MYILERQQFVPRGLEEVSAFFAQPENLAILTPSWLGFEMLTPSPVPMHRGALIDYQIRLGPFPLRWRTMITEFDPPHRFVDEQLLGPYSWWHHTHAFEACDDGTLITDTVRYLMPFGIIGRLVHGLMVRHQLKGIFDTRRCGIAREFGARKVGETT